jgi:hypothetical protein
MIGTIIDDTAAQLRCDHNSANQRQKTLSHDQVPFFKSYDMNGCVNVGLRFFGAEVMNGG